MVYTTIRQTYRQKRVINEFFTDGGGRGLQLDFPLINNNNYKGKNTDKVSIFSHKLFTNITTKCAYSIYSKQILFTKY